MTHREIMTHAKHDWCACGWCRTCQIMLPYYPHKHEYEEGYLGKACIHCDYLKPSPHSTGAAK
jgi:hypothetical protein